MSARLTLGEESGMMENVSDMSDQDIKDIMKAIARANGRPLSDERIEADLRAYKGYLAAIDRITAYNFAIEDEPAFHFSLTPHFRNGAKERSR